MKIKCILVVGLIWAVTSCNKDGQSSTTVSEMPKSDKFAKVVSVQDSSIELSSVISIENWTMTERGLLCRSRNTEKVFYLFDPSTFATLDSFATTGQGPGEYLVPRLVKSSLGSEITSDLAKGYFYNMSNGQNLVAEMPPTRNNLNNPIEIKFPVLGFNEPVGDDRIWVTIDVTTGQRIDSICFEKESVNSPVPLDFKVGSNGNNVVIGGQFTDKVHILNVDDNGKINSDKILKGENSSSSMQPYYIAVECGEEQFYLLSAKRLQISDEGFEGNCAVEVYNYDGDPLALINLEFIPARIILDSKQNRLIAISATDSRLHFINL